MRKHEENVAPDEEEKSSVKSEVGTGGYLHLTIGKVLAFFFILICTDWVVLRVHLQVKFFRDFGRSEDFS